MLGIPVWHTKVRHPLVPEATFPHKVASLYPWTLICHFHAHKRLSSALIRHSNAHKSLSSTSLLHLNTHKNLSGALIQRSTMRQSLSWTSRLHVAHTPVAQEV